MPFSRPDKSHEMEANQMNRGKSGNKSKVAKKHQSVYISLTMSISSIFESMQRIRNARITIGFSIQ